MTFQERIDAVFLALGDMEKFAPDWREDPDRMKVANARAILQHQDVIKKQAQDHAAVALFAAGAFREDHEAVAVEECGSLEKHKRKEPDCSYCWLIKTAQRAMKPEEGA